ncbi:MAG: hypothetical protein R3Y11_07225 [Pseudomonadota bacterium]
MRNTSFTWSSCFFWLGLFVVGIYGQYLVAGLDVLCLAFIWTLHDERWSRFLWLMPVLIVLQEGGGSMDFGTSIVWYAAMLSLFLLGRCIFAVESIVFMLAFSLGMGVIHYILLSFMTGLQKINVTGSSLVHGSILQAICVLVLWGLVTITRQRFMKHAHTV